MTSRSSVHRLIMGLTLATAALGYDLRTDDSGIYTGKWYTTPVPLEIKMSTTTNLTDGRSLNSSVRDAATTWNSQVETVRLTTSSLASGDRVSNNRRNELVIAKTIDGDAFGANTLAVTLSFLEGNEVVEADIIFNGNDNWDSYSGAFRNSNPDIHRVALHEIGHVIGLDHPDEAGQSVSAIMNSRASSIATLQPDDIAGAQRLYGAPGVVPPNDAFEQAAELTVIDTLAIATSSNVNASRQPGEPAHAAVPQGHSIWWRWKPTSDQSARVDTFGSDFDTVLAVYTGNSLSSLVTVTSNDDEETTADNPTPSRKRTSLATFNATAGNSYYIAVDGWGDPDRFPAGSTGFVTLRLSVDRPYTAPSVRTPASDLTRNAGDRAVFTLEFDGYPTPSLQWQRRRAGTDTWTNLTDTDGFYGSTTGGIGFTCTYAMNGDALRCVATNAAGTITSAPYTLTVRPGDLPTITSQPGDATLNDGESAELRVVATNVWSYQWYHNGDPIPGATSSVLRITDPQVTDSGIYTVVLTNATGSITSVDALVDVVVPPHITNLGTRVRRLSEGPAGSLSVEAVGSGTLSYQWIHDGRPVLNATSPTYQPPEGASGAYWARVSDANGVRHGAPFFVLPGARHSRISVWAQDDWATTVPATINDAVAADLSWNSAIVLRHNGRVEDWGYTIHAETSNLDPTDAVAVALGRMGGVVLNADGTVSGSGWMRTPPPDLANVVAIAAGAQFAVALRNNGTVAVWGSLNGNYDAAVGYAPPPGLDHVVAIGTGDYRILAIRADGTVVTWGSTYTAFAEATVIPDVNDAVAVAGGIDHAIILRANGSVVSWGDRVPVPETAQSDVVAIAAGTYHSLALKADGSVIAWGYAQGEHVQVPADLPPAFAIAANGNISLALTEVAESSLGRLVNLSVRSHAGSGDQTLVMGFVVSGTQVQSVLSRGIGPALTTYGVNGAMTNPKLTLFDGSGQTVATNSDWKWWDEQTRETTAQLGAFPLSDGALDAALLVDLAPGAYSAHVTTEYGSDGVALIEAYDATQLTGARFSNLSARTVAGTGDKVLVAGFVLTGASPRSLLIRGVGPALAAYGIPANTVLANPRLQLFQGDRVIGINDDWGGSPEFKATFTAIGAFPLPVDTSRDAALMITLDPGAYTVQVSDVDGGEGIALVEIYELP